MLTPSKALTRGIFTLILRPPSYCDDEPTQQHGMPLRDSTYDTFAHKLQQSEIK